MTKRKITEDLDDLDPTNLFKYIRTDEDTRSKNLDETSSESDSDTIDATIESPEESDKDNKEEVHSSSSSSSYSNAYSLGSEDSLFTHLDDLTMSQNVISAPINETQATPSNFFYETNQTILGSIFSQDYTANLLNLDCGHFLDFSS